MGELSVDVDNGLLAVVDLELTVEAEVLSFDEEVVWEGGQGGQLEGGHGGQGSCSFVLLQGRQGLVGGHG